MRKLWLGVFGNIYKWHKVHNHLFKKLMQSFKTQLICFQDSIVSHLVSAVLDRNEVFFFRAVMTLKRLQGK